MGANSVGPYCISLMPEGIQNLHDVTLLSLEPRFNPAITLRSHGISRRSNCFQRASSCSGV